MTGYKRFPTLSGTHIAFVCEDDLWLAPRSGGEAWRLITGFGEIRYPVLSPDGKRLAFSANTEGSFEIYTLAVGGGEPERLTFEGTGCAPIGFRPGGQLLYRSSHGSPFPKEVFIYQIELDGSGRTRLPVGRGMHASFAGDDDRVVIGQDQVDAARWKRYRGGTAGKVWIGRLSSGQFQRLGSLGGNPVLPQLIGERIYFLTDTDGVANVWSCDLEGSDLRRHTDSRDYYCRFLQAHEGVLIYQRAGELALFDTSTEREQALSIETRPSGAQRRRKFVAPDEHLQELDLAADGKRLVATVRGKALTMPAWGGAVRQLGRRSGVRYRLPVWVGTGNEVALVSDEGGEEAIEIHDTATGNPVTRIRPAGLGRIARLAGNPAARALAVTDVAGRLVYVELARPDEPTTVAETDRGALREPTFSPDGRWLAYIEPITHYVHGGILHLYGIDDGARAALNPAELPTHSPSFDPHGRLLYVASERTFNPVLNFATFGAACTTGTRLYAYVLQRDGMSPNDPRWLERVEREDKKRESKREEDDHDGQDGHDGGGHEDDGDTPATPDPIHIDLEGLPERVVELSDIEVGQYEATAAGDYKLIYLSHPTSGLLDHDIFEGGDLSQMPSLMSYDLKTAKQTTVQDGVFDFRVRGSKTLVWSGHGLHLLDTGEKPPEEPAKPGCNRHTGAVDVHRMRIEVVPGDEWRQMFVEAWRLQREHFWTESMAGIDWQAILDHYLPLVERVATRSELSDLIWELQGELGTSHAYELGGDYPDTADYPVGGLGADLEWDGQGYRIRRILRGDPWRPGCVSPLAAPGVDVAEGDRILAVDGQWVAAERPPGALLVHRAKTDVELIVESADGGEPRRVVAHTLASERALRYRHWVHDNRRWVHERSHGRLGYLHIPDMSGPGLSEFFRAYRAETRHPGLVVDIRNNGGGFVSQIIVDHLRRTVIGYDRPRYGRPETYPADTVRGPIVGVCDQYAGSDGDIFSQAFKTEEIGPLIGMRTWGGVVGIELNEQLADGTLVTQPEFAFYFHTAGWGVENHGVDPDIEVDWDPQSLEAGRDPQLERAVDEALSLLETKPGSEPDWPEPPSRKV